MINFRSLLTLRLMFFSYLVLVVFMVTACQKNQNDTPAISTDCLNNPSVCQSGVYNNSYGYTPYGNSSGYGYGSTYQGSYVGGGGPFYYLNNSAYLCNCPSGSIPTYNNYAGLGCVQSNLVGGIGGYGGGIGAYAYFGFNANGANNNQWVNIPQISNTAGYTNNGCYNGVIQSCVVTNVNSCGTGYTCRPSSGASALGLCTANGANGQYGQIYR